LTIPSLLLLLLLSSSYKEKKLMDENSANGKRIYLECVIGSFVGLAHPGKDIILCLDSL
jgi:hypothetical protein